MKRSIIVLMSVLLPLTVSGQDGMTDGRDTLRASVKTAFRNQERSLGQISTGIKEIRGIVSPLGEGDPIRWAQTLPGVSMGADGGTAMYVRGGNMGNNLFSVDGVPIYGFSHLLGLTNVLPSEVIEGAKLVKGGFTGADMNLTSSHLSITTKDVPDDKVRTNVSVNNFLLGAGSEGVLGKRKAVSYILAGRISPLQYEYMLFRKIFPETFSVVRNFRARVGDIYAKLGADMGERDRLSASFLYSRDMYNFELNENSKEKMGWQNLVSLLKYEHKGDVLKFDVSASYSAFSTVQDEWKTFHGTRNYQFITSELKESKLTANFRTDLSDAVCLDWGTNLRYAEFYPGITNPNIKPAPTLLAGVYLQTRYSYEDVFTLNASVKGSYFRNFKNIFQSFDPELDVHARLRLPKGFALEATFDRVVQYYHTLEGLPLGWSLDMIVPSMKNIKPESAHQAAVDAVFRKDRHHLSFGGFYKKMDDVVYFVYGQALFAGALSRWYNNVSVGEGRSYGTELFYEYSGKDFHANLSYTWSRTTRFGFERVNRGEPFHARFDREHVMNASAQWKGISLTVIFESGQWEMAAAEDYVIHTPSGDLVGEYYSGTNNYHMPNLFRIDIGYMHTFHTGKIDHDLNVGVCNVTNHFNPFMIYYDTRANDWRMLALIPVLPNLSYRISF